MVINFRVSKVYIPACVLHLFTKDSTRAYTSKLRQFCTLHEVNNGHEDTKADWYSLVAKVIAEIEMAAI